MHELRGRGPAHGRSIFTLAAVAATSLSGTAWGQVQPQSSDQTQSANTLQAVVVTGTLIRGLKPTGTDVLTMSPQDITASGVPDTDQLIETIPQITNAFNQTPSVPIGQSGDTIVSPTLRNLLGGTTLVLVDGHRVAGAGVLDTAIDPDIIPPVVLDRVEIALDGGSATYGSDAVGGVINFITKKSFDGFEVSGHYGFADDYTTYDASAIAGKSWDGGSGYIAYAFSRNSALFGAYRSYVKDTAVQTGDCAPGNVEVGGTFYALPALEPNTKNTCNPNDWTAIYPSNVRHSVFGSLNQDLVSNVSLDVKAYYTWRESVTYTDPNAQPTDGTASSGTITPSNPYYRPVTPGGTAPETVYFTYAGVESPASPNDLEEWGITPDLTVKLGDGWNLDAMLNYGTSTVDFHQPLNNDTAEAQALAGTTTETALDPYDVAATNSAVLGSIFNDFYGYSRQTLTDGRLIVQGHVLQLPGGSLRVAVGAEVYRETIDAIFQQEVPGQETLEPLTAGNQTVRSGFTEINVPLIGKGNALRGVQEITLDVSGRYDNYSTFGSTMNPKIALDYKPVDWVTFRGNWGTSYNAPALSDTHGADSRIVVVPVSPWLAPGASSSNFSRTSVALVGGNPSLQPQKAHTFAFGLNAQPPAAPGLSLDLEYYEALITHLVAVPPLTSQIFSPAYVQFATVNPSLAYVLQRAGNLPIQGPPLASLYANGASPYGFFEFTRQNLGALHQHGLDFNVAYHRSIGAVSIMSSLGGEYVLERELQAVAGEPFVDAFETPGGSRLNLAASLGASVGAFTGRGSLEYSGGYDVNPALVTSAILTPQTHVDGFAIVNLYFRYRVPEKLVPDLELTLNVDNVLNTNPPFYNAGAGYAYSTLGRLLQFGFTKEF